MSEISNKLSSLLDAPQALSENDLAGIVWAPPHAAYPSRSLPGLAISAGSTSSALARRQGFNFACDISEGCLDFRKNPDACKIKWL
jgi:hypothetical protein